MSSLTRPRDRSVHPISRPTGQRRRHRPVLEALEDRLAPAGIVNGDFAVSNPADPNYGWTTRGNASIAGGEGILDEGTTVQTEFSQTFTIPTGTTTLGFTIVTANLLSNGAANPPDAFEAALLDPSTMQPLVGPATGLSNTDAFLNIQQTGQVYYAPQVTVPGAGASGAVASLNYPVNVSVDVSSLPANTQATLFFDLIGFSPATSSVTISNVTPSAVNTTPTANPQSLTTAQDVALPITLTGSDPNSPPLSLTYAVTAGPTHGMVTGTAPDLTYTPDTGYFGPDSLQFTTDNGVATSFPATVAIAVVGQPTAHGQSLIAPQDTAIPITLTGSDPNTPPLTLTYTVTSGPAQGTLSGTAPDLTYTPNAGSFGPDSFSFTAGNGVATSAPATIALDVIGQPTANAQSVITGQGAAVAITLTGSDPNTPALTLTYIVTANPAHGTLSGTAPELTYTPSTGTFGPDSFSFKVNNGTLDSAVATVSIDVVGQPTANAQSVTTAQGMASPITLTGSDPNNPTLPLTYTVTVSPARGTLSGTAPDLTYTPTTGTFGPDSFSFKVNNGTLDSAAATVSIDVVGQPTANAQAVTTAQGVARPITLSGSDPNNPTLPLTYTVTVSPAHGTLSGAAPGLTYTPTAGYFGSDSFQFTTSNGTVTSAPAVVALTIVGQPTAHAQAVTSAQSTATAITLTGSDPNNPPLPLTYSVTVSPAHGTLSGTAPVLTYMPTSGYFGPDSLQFTVGNGVATSTPATIALNVVGQPTANAQSVTTSENTSRAITLTGSDPNTPPLPLTYSVTVSPAHGTLSGAAPDLTYTPSSGYFGADSFSFTAGNSVATSTPTTVAVIIVGPPTANAQSVTTTQGIAKAITLTGSDPNNPPLPLTFTVTVSPAHGTLSGTAPDLTYTPSSGFSGADSFSFTAGNGIVTSTPANVALTVTPSGATSPVANNDSYATAEGKPLAITAPGVLANDTAAAGATLTAVLVTGPAHGTFALNPDGSFTYTPATGFSGSDSFTYQASAGTNLSNVATVALTVTPAPAHLLPDTPYYNYLRKRRDLDPARFDSYHPKLGALLGLEMTGIPTAPTQIVPANHRFNAAAERSLYQQNPDKFDARQPVLGALFRLETASDGPPPTDLLPDTPHFNALRMLYERDPEQFDREHPYYGAVIALENGEAARSG